MLRNHFAKLKNSLMKKVIAIASTVAILFSVIAIPLAARAESSEKMFVISPNAQGETKYANVFVPLDFLEVGGNRLHSQENDEYYYFKLSFKLKLMNEKMPILGIIRYAYWNQGGQSEYWYTNNNQETHDDKLLTAEYDEDTLTYTAIIKMWINPDPDSGVHTALTIGNMEHNNSWHRETNFDAHLEVVKDKKGNLGVVVAYVERFLFGLIIATMGVVLSEYFENETAIEILIISVVLYIIVKFFDEKNEN